MKTYENTIFLLNSLELWVMWYSYDVTSRSRSMKTIRPSRPGGTWVFSSPFSSATACHGSNEVSKQEETAAKEERGRYKALPLGLSVFFSDPNCGQEKNEIWDYMTYGQCCTVYYCIYIYIHKYMLICHSISWFSGEFFAYWCILLIVQTELVYIIVLYSIFSGQYGQSDWGWLSSWIGLHNQEICSFFLLCQHPFYGGQEWYSSNLSKCWVLLFLCFGFFNWFGFICKVVITVWEMKSMRRVTKPMMNMIRWVLRVTSQMSGISSCNIQLPGAQRVMKCHEGPVTSHVALRVQCTIHWFIYKVNYYTPLYTFYWMWTRDVIYKVVRPARDTCAMDHQFSSPVGARTRANTAIANAKTLLWIRVLANEKVSSMLTLLGLWVWKIEPPNYYTFSTSRFYGNILCVFYKLIGMAWPTPVSGGFVGHACCLCSIRWALWCLKVLCRRKGVPNRSMVDGQAPKNKAPFRLWP